MSILSFIYDLIFGPLILLFDAVYSIMFRMLNNEGASIIALSLAINLLTVDFYRIIFINMHGSVINDCAVNIK